MEEVGIITGYRAHVNPKALGMSLTAIIRMSVAPDQVKELTAVVKKCVGVSECYSGRGEASTFFIQAHLMSIERLEALLDRLAPYGTPIATIVLSSPVEHRAIEPPQRE
jgi:Lrp/AsnC family leucine-responsive transcriptional regulator